MECVHGTASLPLNGETTEEVYLAPGTGKPGAHLDNSILPPNCFIAQNRSFFPLLLFIFPTNSLYLRYEWMDYHDFILREVWS